MKRYGNLWARIICWENLLLAARKARRGKRDRGAVQRFDFDQEVNLLLLQKELIEGTYRPGPFTTHWITRPKARLISAAPYRDRVVHHALMNILEPVLDCHFHPDSFACRKGKGTHAAVRRLQQLMRENTYLLQLDIRKFFPSIDHEIMKQVFRKRFKDVSVLRLLDMFVDYSNPQETVVQWFKGDNLFSPIDRRKGIPIGNLTSQWFANWYLDDLDHFVTSELGIGGYVRYCDDFILLSNSRSSLKDALQKVIRYLQVNRRLKLHMNKQAIIPASTGVRFVGYRVWPWKILLPKDNIKAFVRRIEWMKTQYADGSLDWKDIKLRIDSWIGHAKNADSNGLLHKLSKDWFFTRGKAINEPGSPRWVVEQQRQQLPFGEPQQEQSRQPQQQYRVSCGSSALSKNKPGIVKSKDFTSEAKKVLALLRSHRRQTA